MIRLGLILAAVFVPPLLPAELVLDGLRPGNDHAGAIREQQPAVPAPPAAGPAQQAPARLRPINAGDRRHDERALDCAENTLKRRLVMRPTRRQLFAAAATA